MQTLSLSFAVTPLRAVLGLETSLAIAAIGLSIVAIIVVTLVGESRRQDDDTEHLDDEAVQ